MVTQWNIRMWNARIPQQNGLERYYSCLEFRQNEARYIWRTDASLKRFCVSQFLNRPGLSLDQDKLTYLLQNDSEYSKPCIQAYLEEIVYLVSKQRFKLFHFRQSPEETWNFYLQIAQDISRNKIEKWLDLSSKKDDKKLFYYLLRQLTSAIRTEFYQLTGYGKYCEWYALKRISKEKLSQKLSQLGITDSQQIQKHWDAKELLYTVYSNLVRGQRWVEPTVTDYQNAVNYGRKQSFFISEYELKRLINICVKAIYPPETLQEALDYQKYPPSQSSLNSSENEEQKILNQKVRESFDKLDSQQQYLLLYWYGVKLNQNEIAQIVNYSQATMSRRLRGVKRILLENLIATIERDFNQRMSEDKIILLEKYLSKNRLLSLTSQWFKERIMPTLSRANPETAIIEWLTQKFSSSPTPKTQEKIFSFAQKITQQCIT
ncbi:MAG: hypothetical protein AB4058_09715 [Microcystaceae cyanobacterium]